MSENINVPVKTKYFQCYQNFEKILNEEIVRKHKLAKNTFQKTCFNAELDYFCQLNVLLSLSKG